MTRNVLFVAFCLFRWNSNLAAALTLYSNEGSLEDASQPAAQFEPPSKIDARKEAAQEYPQAKVKVQTAAVAGFAIVAFIGVFVWFHNFEPTMMGYAACVVYIVLSLLCYTSIKTAATSTGFQFEPAVAVIVTDFIKLVLSLVLYTARVTISVFRGEKSIVPEGATLQDVAGLALAACLFFFNNLLGLIAVGANDLSTFAVVRVTDVLWTAAIWCVFFRARFSGTQIVALIGIFVSVCLNQHEAIQSLTLTPALVLVGLVGILDTSACVVNEFVLKQNSALDINFQNAVLYSFVIIFGIIGIGVCRPAIVSSPSAFFEGFDHHTVLLVAVQAFHGLVVSRILKYADSVLKTMLASTKPMLLVFVAPFLGVPSQCDVVTVVSAVTVGLCVFRFEWEKLQQKSLPTRKLVS